MLSVVIPSRNEKYLKKTILDLLEKSVEEIEIIAVLDGYWPDRQDIVDHKSVHYIHFTKPRSMRNAINKGVSIARGEYIMKTDAHCMFGHGFDKILRESCRDDYVVVPTRRRLNPETWQLTEEKKPPINYMYLAYPEDPTVWGGPSLQGKEWRERNLSGELRILDIDNLMTAQGSCWYMKKSYYEFLELMDEKNYGEFGKEMQEIGLKCWLSRGRMIRNKNTYYAHWHKTKKDGRGYSLNRGEFKKASDYTRRWINEKMWHKQTMTFGTLIDIFWPIPGWPEDWKEKNAKK